MENGRRKVTALENKRDKRLEANEHLRRQLNIRMKSKKVIKTPSVTVPQVANRSEGRIRSRSQFGGYKSTPEVARLNVTLGDIQKITKPMTPAPSKSPQKAPRFD